LRIRAIEPFERLSGLSSKRIDLRKIVWVEVGLTFQHLRQRSIGFGLAHSAK
jgi:hypothetical protein